MKLKQKLAIASASLFGLVGLGGGVALAQSPPSSTALAAATAPSPAPQVNAPDTPTAPEAPDAIDGTGTEVEKPGAEATGDAALPGGGHADPAGQNVDHQFEGVE